MNWPEDYVNKIIQGDAREIMKQMPDESVQCVITSPPYWGLRDYGLEPQIWGEVPEQNCVHVWGKEIIKKGITGGKDNPFAEKLKIKGRENYQETPDSQSQFCQLCGAWRGSLGLEPSPELYIAHLVEICREIKRVLRKDGVFWLNMGDSYWGGKGQSSQAWSTTNQDRETLQKSQHQICGMNETRPADGKHDVLKPKDLCEIPSEVVRALRADGWWLRSRIPWLKRNSMPESITDRPATAVEYVFLLTKSAKCFYDNEAVKMPNADPLRTNYQSGSRLHGENADRNDNDLGERSKGVIFQGRNRRNSDWFFESWQGLYEEDGEPLAFIVNPASFKEAHFATFPPGLVRPMILAGTSEHGCCSECGAPWERVSEKKTMIINRSSRRGAMGEFGRTQSSGTMVKPASSKTLGWRPTCSCYADIEPCVVLDPFMGSGTVAEVAIRTGRNFIGIDLSPEYYAMAERRLKPFRQQIRLI